MSVQSDCLEFLDGWADGVEGLPDGAWYEAMQEGVRQFCQSRRCRLDPNETVNSWIASRSSQA